jgi:hypothetical protein
MQRDKPDFIIVGAMKSGTTSLGFHLRNHKNVCIPKGELHYFDRRSNLQKGEDWYIQQLLRGCKEETLVVGEKTPTYCYLPEVAGRIHRFAPDVKLIWIFREPVSRAYSNYLHAYREGATRLSFDEAIAREKELIQENRFFGYLERSRYYLQVERFLKYFKMEQMHFMLFEELIRDTQEELERLFDFLGVPVEGFEYIDEPRGTTVHPRWQRSVWLARRIFGRGAIFGSVRFLNTFLKAPGYPELPDETREKLMPIFKDDNEKLARLIGKDLSCWS